MFRTHHRIGSSMPHGTRWNWQSTHSISVKIKILFFRNTRHFSQTKLFKRHWINTWTANNIRVTEERKKELWSWRSKLQYQAILDCNNLLAYIGLARRVFHLREKRVEYWSGKAIEARNYIKKWRESDKQRYGT